MGLTPEPAVPPLAAVGAVALLPRAGWLVAAATVLVGCGPHPGAARAGRRGGAARRSLLRRDGSAGRCPRGAPLLGLIGLAGAYPALAGRARAVCRARRARPGRRLLADPGRAAAGAHAALRPAAGVPARGSWDGGGASPPATALARWSARARCSSRCCGRFRRARPALARPRPLPGRRHRRRDACGPGRWPRDGGAGRWLGGRAAAGAARTVGRRAGGGAVAVARTPRAPLP